MKKQVHVTFNKGKQHWETKKSGNTRASSVSKRKIDAVNDARNIAKTNKTELIIHGRDGKFQSRDSYGNDPFPPKG